MYIGIHMSNITAYLPLKNGGLLDLIDNGHTSKEAVHILYTDDIGVPPHSLNIEITTDSGKVVKVVIPYDNTKAIVMIDGDRVE
jgi:hypothetical protein